MKVTLGSFSNQGPRKANEDSVLASVLFDGSCVLAVADGLGGHFGGAEASAIAVQMLAESNPSTLIEFEEAFRTIHERIQERQRNEPINSGMATTLTAVRIFENRLIGAHCGDTRCVLQRALGIKKLTVEHTEAQRLFQVGKLTKEQLLTYPRRNVLDSALGVQDGLRIDTFEHDLLYGDKILITSDGVHEVVRLRQLLGLLEQPISLEDTLNALTKAVIATGAEDNFSASLAFVN